MPLAEPNIESKTQTRNKKRMGLSPKTQTNAISPIHHDTIVSETKSDAQLNSEIAIEFVKRTEKSMLKTNELTDKAMDARAAMDIAADQWKRAWFDFMDTADDRLKNLRMTRMAIDSEMRQLMASFREVRNFFLDANYETEISRLKEFVELCQHLQVLRDTGFLDKIADTMLLLGERKAQ